MTSLKIGDLFSRVCGEKLCSMIHQLSGQDGKDAQTSEGLSPWLGLPADKKSVVRTIDGMEYRGLQLASYFIKVLLSFEFQNCSCVSR